MAALPAVGLASALLLALLAWSAVTSVEVVVSAPAAARAAGGNAEIRAAESRRVAAVHAAEGDRVAEGDLLIRLEGVPAAARLTALRQTLAARTRAAARLDAVLAAVDGARSPALDPADPADAGPLPEDPEAAGRVLELRSRLASLARGVRSVEDELRGLVTQADGLAGLRAIAAERLRALQRAARQGAISRFDLLRARQDLLAHEVELEALRSRRRVLTERAAAERETLRATRLGQQRALAEERHALAIEIDELAAALAEAEQRVDHGLVRATATGIVDRLTVAPGDLAERGEVLAVIVPDGLPVGFEAHMAPAQMGWVRPGQPCRLKLDAAPFQRHGALACRVGRVAADTRDAAGLGPYYAVEIVPEPGVVDLGGRPFEPWPGATATVDVVAGRRTVLGFVTEPLRRFSAAAFRQP